MCSALAVSLVKPSLKIILNNSKNWSFSSSNKFELLSLHGIEVSTLSTEILNNTWTNLHISNIGIFLMFKECITQN